MFKRLATVTATMLAVLMTVGIGLAATSAPDNSSTTTTSMSPTTTLPDPGETETVTYEVGEAGTVRISSDGTSLTIVAVDATEGWATEVEVAVGREVEADFRNGDRRFQFNAEIEDGQIQVRVRERTTGMTEATTTTTTTIAPVTGPPTTIPSTGDASGLAITYDAGAAGTVSIISNGSSLTVVSVNSDAGWSTDVEVASGREIEIDFRNRDRRIQFNAELEDGDIRIRVRDRVTDDSRDDDADNSGHGNSDDDDADNSGHGNSDDDDDDDSDDE